MTETAGKSPGADIRGFGRTDAAISKTIPGTIQGPEPFAAYSLLAGDGNHVTCIDIELPSVSDPTSAEVQLHLAALLGMMGRR